LSQLRPISLASNMYKILSKVLANRVKRGIPSIIVKTQSVFLGGKKFVAKCLANEEVDEAKMLDNKRLVFKVDYKKVYDLISWGFLVYKLENLDFRKKWVS